jgi:hypothetical protein
MKTLVALLIVIALGIGGFFLWDARPAGMDDATVPSDDTGSAMRVEENMVVVMDQKPGNEVKATMVFLAAPGYLVIHEDVGGARGPILGASAFLPAGESRNVTVALSRMVRDGETLHAELHAERSGNTAFSVTEDPSVMSAFGGPIEGIFEVTSDASGEAPISI